MLPLYTRLSDEALLKKCIGGFTQNQNESFNATIWKRCPKEKKFGTAAVQRALGLAILSWNMGRQGLHDVLMNLGLSPNKFTEDGIIAKDKRRVSDSVQYTQKPKKQKTATTCTPVSQSDYIPGGW